MGFKIDEQLKKMAYKLATETTLLLLAFFYFLLAAETILPGFISSRLSIVYPAIFVIVFFFFTVLLGRKIGVKFDENIRNRNIILLGLVLIFPLIIVSLFRFGIWMSLLIGGILFALICFFLIGDHEQINS